MEKRRMILGKVDLSKYNLSEDKSSNRIESNEIDKSDIPKITLEDIFPFKKINELIEELDSHENEFRDLHSGESEEEKIMRALENGYGDLYGFD
jgi:hypothetical protein